MKPRILTGDRPTGRLHIGHYFGSLQNRVQLQNEGKYDPFILIADVQALTDNFNNPKKVHDNVKELMLDYLAVGIDPNKSTIFVQSMIPEIAELTVFFSNLVTVARLQRNPTVKTEISQKQELFKESVTYGFLGYPVSQAADILVVKGDVVPVGDDQLPMIEQTREIARKFNSYYGDVFPEPKEKLSKFPRIKGLDGGAKMGKSLNNAIYLSDTPEIITEKVKNAYTDSLKIKIDDPGHPDDCAVFYYFGLFNPEYQAELKPLCEQGKLGCFACKQRLAKTIIDYLEPIRTKRKYYEKRPDLVKDMLIDGTNKARTIAKQTMAEVREAMHLNHF